MKASEQGVVEVVVMAVDVNGRDQKEGPNSFNKGDKTEK